VHDIQIHKWNERQLVIFLSFQETKLSPRKIEYPEVERRVLGQPAQSTSK
jgi:hypothetical protein